MGSIAIAGDTSGSITITVPAVAGNNTLILPATSATIDIFPVGTALIFQQTAAPTGWTKVTTNDNAALRIVSGSAGTGGTVDFTTAFASQAVTGSVANTGSTTATNNSYTPAGTVGTSGSTTATNNSYTPAGSVSTSTSTGITYLNDPYYMPYHNHNVEGAAPGHSVTTNFGGGATCSTFGFNPDSVNGCYGYGAIWDVSEAGSNGYHNHSASSSSSFSGSAATITQAAHTHTGGTFTGTAATITQAAHTHTSGAFTGNAINLAVKYVDAIVATKN